MTITLDGTGAKTVTKNPKSDFYRVVEELNDIAALANELRTDSGTDRTTLLALETLAEELGTDHGTFKDVVDELVTDHGTFKTAVDETETLIEEMYDDEEAKRNVLDFIQADGVMFSDYTFATQAAVTILGAGSVTWIRNGVRRYASVVGNITLDQPSTNTIADTKFGAWRVVIDDLGAISTQAANASTMQFDNAEDALLNIAAIAPTADTVTLGYITIENTSGAADFTIGTTDTNSSTTGTYYYERTPRKQGTGLTAALGAATAVGTTPENYATGTRDYCINGLNVAQDSAEADKTFDDADTVGQDQFGGWLIVTNLAQSATYSLAADGIAGSVSAMTYADAAAAQTAIDTLVDNLPSMFCPVSQLILTNNLVGTWTAGTDDINGTDGTAAFTDATVGTWARASSTGFDSHQITAPSIPAVLTASKPSSAPATLSNSAPDALSASTSIDSPAAAVSADAIDDFTFRTLGTP